MRAFHRERELRIDEGDVDDGAEPVALNLFGDEVSGNLDDAEDREQTQADLASRKVVLLMVNAASPVFLRVKVPVAFSPTATVPKPVAGGEMRRTGIAPVPLAV